MIYKIQAGSLRWGWGRKQRQRETEKIKEERTLPKKSFFFFLQNKTDFDHLAIVFFSLELPW